MFLPRNVISQIFLKAHDEAIERGDIDGIKAAELGQDWHASIREEAEATMGPKALSPRAVQFLYKLNTCPMKSTLLPQRINRCMEEIRRLEIEARDRHFSTDAFYQRKPIPQLLPRISPIVAIQDDLGTPLDANATIEAQVLCDRCQNLCRVVHEVWTRGSLPRSPEEISDASVAVIGHQYFHYDASEVRIFRHYDTFSELELSCHRGCHLCIMIWSSLSDEGMLGFRQTFQEFDGAEDFLKRVLVDIQFSCSDFSMMAVTVNNECAIRGEELNISSSSTSLDWNIRNISPARLGLSNASDTAFALATGWLHKCLTKHIQCRQANNFSIRLPTRLIDVGAMSGSGPRLICTENLDSSPLYVALSHCWGGANVLKLIPSNLDQWLELIPLNALPKSFQDAFIITRRLGYQYLWVDALCIIQDSDEDWNKEAAKMGNVYQGAVLTIASVAAKDSHQGLFTKGNPLIDLPCNLPGDENHPFAVCRIPRSDFEPCPLHQRAWIIQERVLSIRTLSYTHSGIAWDCHKWNYTETNPAGVNAIGTSPWTYPATYYLKLAWQRLLNCQPGQHDHEQVHLFYNNWGAIMSAYTKANLTYERDRLVALNGVLDALQSSGFTFTAGMCEQYMPQEILWYTSFPRSSTLRQSIPSWSCAFRKGEFVNEHDPMECRYGRVFVSKIVEIRKDPPSIRCTGLTRKAQLQYHEESYLLILTPAAQTSELAKEATGRNVNESTNLELLFKPDISPLSQGDVTLLLISHQEEDLEPASGLVLTESLENKNEFERIGFFQLEYSSQCPPWAGEQWSYQRIVLV